MGREGKRGEFERANRGRMSLGEESSLKFFLKERLPACQMQFFPMTAHQFHLICFAGSNKALDIQGLLMKFISFLEPNDELNYV